ncbi:2,3,4,5-tetrahydropyridine-2,6-dicarboxylate N-succinyltransferase [Candidatus Photodesmus katoptron]|uniref:2,3,4,5-tetrahydropyridine-2,6-dicarboxylate N-succinyltransferase n=1 Tax=Candidatus Photodesmus katoptron Akat1 TaxID=1236703 RepID=S3DLA9_9GAMM|nr:DapH/DapD/GlmU-related protein [Candidatus Photodesmus katoptron]EPE37939.1 tetrahydrodipicolinate succinylase [Candidatus Photodesmus katoptron Akat1]KEY90274.1 2,3,4,5-tetrahydropyridine-2,6-dicarboxylate N-succinyltransferase [Candidatus Photodesmus katoptron]
MSYFSLAFGIATKNRDGKIIEAFFPQPILKPSDCLVNSAKEVTYFWKGNTVIELSNLQADKLANTFKTYSNNRSIGFSEKSLLPNQSFILVALEVDKKPESIAEVFLKLQLISHRLVKPNNVILDGIFALLHNIAWTNKGPIDLPELVEYQIKARGQGNSLTVNCIDKFPKMVDYIVPSGVRIADASRVRLGAYLGKGTTVMHEGFINFNAGTLGMNMVEGRISSGVIIGVGTDIGGGASIMGTLSGGGCSVISIGKNALLGANSGIGFPLGDRCIIEAGLYLTAGSKVLILNTLHKRVKVVKAYTLSNVPDLLFRRNSITGQIECLKNNLVVQLNSDLHNNN